MADNATTDICNVWTKKSVRPVQYFTKGCLLYNRLGFFLCPSQCMIDEARSHHNTPGPSIMHANRPRNFFHSELNPNDIQLGYLNISLLLRSKDIWVGIMLLLLLVHVLYACALLPIRWRWCMCVHGTDWASSEQIYSRMICPSNWRWFPRTEMAKLVNRSFSMNFVAYRYDMQCITDG